MKNSFSSSHHSINHKPKNNVVDRENEKLQQGARLHKAYHSSNNLLKPKIQKHEHPQGINIDTLKINHSCVLCSKAFSSIEALNVHMKWHRQNGSKKGSNNYDLDKFPPIDLTKYLPPIRYETKKRSWDYFLDVETVNVAEIMVDMSQQSSANLNVNHRDSKRMKLCSNVDDDEKINEQGGVLQTSGKNNEKYRLVVRLKIPKGLSIQTSQASKQPASDDDDVENNTDEGDESDGESDLEFKSNIFGILI